MIRVEVHECKRDKISPYAYNVFTMALLNVSERPEMQVDGLLSGVNRLLTNLQRNRIEFYIFDDNVMKGGMIFCEDGEDLHFGVVPCLLGSWMYDKTYSKKLYIHALRYLKGKGHTRLLRTMRVDESHYLTHLKEI